MKIIKNYLYNVAYQLFAIIVPVITTPYITRVLGTKGVGVNAYTNSIIQYFVLAGSIGISLYGNRIIAYERDDRSKMSQTFWSLQIVRIFAILVAYAAFLIFLFLSHGYRLAYISQSIQIIAVAFDISWLFMGLEDFRRTVIRNFIVKLFSTIAIFTFVRDSGDTLLYITILSLSFLIGNISLWTHLNQVVDVPAFRQLTFTKHIKGSFFLFIPQISMQIYLVLNKTMLGNMKGVVSVGFYENSDKIVRILLTVITAITTVMMPRMANTFIHKQYQKLNSYLYETIDFVSCVSVLMTAVLAGVAPTFSIWFMGDSFAATGPLIVVLSLVGPIIAWSTVFGSQFLVTTGREHQFTVAVTAGAFVNLIANLFLIPPFGAMGAVIATVIAETLITVVDVWFAGAYIPLKPVFQEKWKYVFAGILVFFATRFFNTSMPGNFISLGVQALAGTIIYLSVCVVLNTSFTTSAFKRVVHFIQIRRNQ